MPNELKKILLLSHSQKSGGAERCLLEAAVGLKKRGYDVSVFIPSVGELNELLIKENIFIKVVPYAIWVHSGFQSFTIFDFVRNLLSIVKYTISIRKMIKKMNPDVVLTNANGIPCGAIACFFLKIKHIWFIHEFGKEDHNLLFNFGFFLSSKIINLTSKKIFVNSELVKLKYQKYIKAQKFAIINYNVSKPDINSELLKIRDRGVDLLLIGQIAKGKGQMDAINALNILVKAGYKIHLIFIGQISNQDYYQEIQDYIIYNNLTKLVRFYAHMPNPYNIISKFTIGLVCSEYEALGRVTIEYMKAGIPVIGANAGNTPFLVTDHGTGLLYDLKHPVDLSKQIIKLISDEAILNKLIKDAELFANNFFNEKKYIDDMSRYIVND